MGICFSSENICAAGTKMASGQMGKVLNLTAALSGGFEISTTGTTYDVTIKVQLSADGTNWRDMTFADGSTTIAATNASHAGEFVDIYGTAAKEARVYVTVNSGCATAAEGSMAVVGVRKESA